VAVQALRRGSLADDRSRPSGLSTPAPRLMVMVTPVDMAPERPRSSLAARSAWRTLGNSAAARVNSMSYMPKWVVLASVIGVIAGLGAVVFYEALDLATHFFLGVLAGYKVPTPTGEGGFLGSAHYVRPWVIPLVVALGGLVAGFVVFTWAPEAEGHGTDAAIEAVHHNPRGIRARAVLVKLFASAVTIGSGGSGGREGPTAQISAGFGSLMARVLDLSPEDGRIAVSVGIGSGIGAIFSAPLGGAVLAADIVYRDDFEFEALLPGAFASIIAYAIFGAFFGYQPLFSIPGGYHFGPFQLAWFAIIGLLAGAIGLLYSKSFYAVVSLAGRLPFSRKLRPAVGAALTGLIALWLPEVLGTGYGWVQKGLSAELSSLPLYMIIALPLARIAATAFSIGSGGSGGVFGPGMVIGAFTGLAVWKALVLAALPGVGHGPAPFMVVGMMATFGGISRAPIAVMLMVAEMTGNIAMIGPAMVAVTLAWFIVGRNDDSIYRSQLRTREDSSAGRLRFGLPLLATLRVADVASPPKAVLTEDALVGAALEILRSADLPGAPVVDERGSYVGTVSTERLGQLAETRSKRKLDGAIDATTATVALKADLQMALEALVEAGGGWVPVTSGDRQVVGIISASDLIGGYHRALDAFSGYVYNVTPHAVALEERVSSKSRVAGCKLRDANLPASCVIVTVQHNGALTYATGSTELYVGDLVNALVASEQVAALRRALRGEDVAASPGPSPPKRQELARTPGSSQQPAGRWRAEPYGDARPAGAP
jgi:chloride channel protein, CIC family